MAYWTLTEDCLVTLKRNWIKYYNDRLDALKELYEHSERQYRNEGNDDIRYGRYSTSSVHDWYDGKIRKLDEWIDNSIADLKNEDAKFDKLWKQACSDYYDSRDYGYVVIYDFYRFEKRWERDSTLDSTHFRVRFTGQTHWYSSCNRRRDLEFVTGKPYFDRHD